MRNRFFLLSVVMSFSLLSADILTTYRQNGIENIEKELDFELSKREYWDRHLLSHNTAFGYLESYANVLTCNKEKSTLTLYMKDKEGKFNLKKRYSAYTGKVKGDKRQEGDLKTPVGIYNLTQKLSNVDSFYGPLAFVTSYPNLYDTYRGKNGSGIWIHGLPIAQERDEFTKGCIAINNDNLECLDKNIDISQTLLIIDEKKITQEVSKKELSKILSQLYEWRYAWLYNDIKAYLDFYAPDFRRYDGMNRDEFVRYKTRVFAKQEPKRIVFRKINLLPYPGSASTYKITFEESYKSPSYAFDGEKVLIVELKENKLQIITER